MSDVSKLRNIALVAHGGAGKTSLAEAMLFRSGVINRLGRVEDGNTALDFQPEELKRQTSILSGFHQLEWQKHTISLIDTPGDLNFFSNTKTCLIGADAVIAVVDAVDGAGIRTEQALEFAAAQSAPCAVFLNKLDRDRANFEEAVQALKESIDPKPIKIHLPIGSGADFNGIVDLVANKAYIADADGKLSPADIPADMADTVEAEREELVENIAEADDALIEKYLEGEPLTDEELVAALKKGVKERIFAPILIGSATKTIGVDLLCDFVNAVFPSPLERPAVEATDANGEVIALTPDPDAPFAGYVFQTIVDPYAGRLTLIKIISGSLGSDGTIFNTTKDTKERFSQLLYMAGKEQKQIKGAGPGAIVTVAKLKETTTGDTLCDESRKVTLAPVEPMNPVISFAIAAQSKDDEDKLANSMSRILEEDVSLKLSRNNETRETLLSGMGQVHIEATIEKVKRKFNLDILISPPTVPYRETITKKVRVQGRHKKQTGGHGQFGDCWIQMEPLARSGGFEFVDKIVGGVIPKQFIPAVEKGIVESAERGFLAGFKTVDFKVTLDDGSFHAVDSSEMAFKVAGSLAFKKAVEQAGPILLEPVLKLSVIVTDDFMGDVMGDLNSRRGRVLGMDSQGKYQVINANVPMSEVLTYATDLSSMTGGRGTFTTEFSHYDELPHDLAKKVIESRQKDDE
ncbi:MAG: elongation factor G [Deltaproteobacteria bacterium]|nr:MAG: elongation factor G [Deltaproteobacteria bacterium]